MLLVAPTERLGGSSVPRLPANHATGVKGKALIRVVNLSGDAEVDLIPKEIVCPDS